MENVGGTLQFSVTPHWMPAETNRLGIEAPEVAGLVIPGSSPVPTHCNREPRPISSVTLLSIRRWTEGRRVLHGTGSGHRLGLKALDEFEEMRLLAEAGEGEEPGQDQARPDQRGQTAAQGSEAGPDPALGSAQRQLESAARRRGRLPGFIDHPHCRLLALIRPSDQVSGPRRGYEAYPRRETRVGGRAPC